MTRSQRILINAAIDLITTQPATNALCEAVDCLIAVKDEESASARTNTDTRNPFNAKSSIWGCEGCDLCNGVVCDPCHSDCTNCEEDGCECSCKKLEASDLVPGA